MYLPTLTLPTLSDWAAALAQLPADAPLDPDLQLAVRRTGQQLQAALRLDPALNSTASLWTLLAAGALHWRLVPLPRVCYALPVSNGITRCSIKLAKATKCRASTVSGNRS